MGKVIIQNYTTKNPLEIMGYEAGICYGSNVEDKEKNIKRGRECLKSGHLRCAEFVQIYFTVDEYSARLIRQLYTHIGGAPTRLQASTRYINYENFKYIIPHTVENNPKALEIYKNTMASIADGFMKLEELGIPNEDSANVLPLGMSTKMVFRTNLRQLMDMSQQRMCSRAYWEFRELMNEMCSELSKYGDEWKEIIPMVCMPKCKALGYCPEKFSCGRMPKKEL